jgi:hypothetical protein
VVVTVAVGAPEGALAAWVAPIAPEPFVPDVSMPSNATTVSDETTLCDRVAFTVALVKGDVANARQISAVPLCALLRTTNDHVSPPPLMPVTEVLEPRR